MDRKETVTKMIEDIASEVCDHLCKYRETADEESVCDYMREHEQCPLDKLY